MVHLIRIGIILIQEIVATIKCKDYDHVVDITSQWPMIGVGGVTRKVQFGSACQMPDGRWIEKPVGLNANYIMENK
jgi:hypothetical protein